MHCRFIKIFILFVFFSSALVGQEIDSLRNAGTPLSFLKLGNLLSNKYGYTDSFYYYIEKAHALAGKTSDKALLEQCAYYTAIYHQQIGNFDSSISILRAITPSRILQGEIDLNTGINYYRMNSNKKAQDFFLKAEREFDTRNNSDGLGLVFCKRAAIFLNEGQNENALAYASRAKSLLPRVKDPFTKTSMLSSLSGIYSIVAGSKKSYLDSSTLYAKLALDLVNAHQFFTKGNQLVVTLSNNYYLRGDYQKSLEYAKQSLSFRKYLFPSEILISYLNLSDCYAAIKDYKSALLYLDSLRVQLPVLNDPYYSMKLFERDYAYNKEVGNISQAMIGLEKYTAVKDSLFNVDKTKAINELEEKYNRSMNEKKISELNQENEIASLSIKFMTVGILASVLTIILVIFFYRQSLLKSKFKSLETEQRLNRARINPHFFFNALTSIQTLASEKENEANISQFISKFAKVMRQSLENTYDELVTVESEIGFITSYLDIQKIRYPKKFSYHIEVDDNLDVNELKIPGMVLQPFIENSIEHGFKGIQHVGALNIYFKKQESQIVVELADNGKGFDTTGKTKEYPSRATQITNERLVLLNKAHRSNAHFELVENEDGGITVKVVLPCIY